MKTNKINNSMDKNVDELEKAKQLIEENEQFKQKEFAEKINLLYKEYGYALQAFSEIRIVKL
jgi:hypothetical protein